MVDSTVAVLGVVALVIFIILRPVFAQMDSLQCVIAVAVPSALMVWRVWRLPEVRG
jgi:uncharacterized MnhB-related membrane protein